jgi:hypothetical protein
MALSFWTWHILLNMMISTSTNLPKNKITSFFMAE